MKIGGLKDLSSGYHVTKNENQENQTLDCVMNYINLTPIGLKRVLIVMEEIGEGLSPAVEQIGC